MTGAAALTWHEAETSAELADRLADWVAARLTEAVAARGVAFLAVSGGSTPKLFLEALSGRDLDWTKVVVTLVDERFVPPSSPRSNQKLVKTHLLRGSATAATFLPLYHEADSAEHAARIAGETLSAAAWPLDVAVLGMGTDGHTASMFPDAPNLDALLDPNTPRIVEAVRVPSAGEPRLTLTLPSIVSARLLVLHIEGVEKRRVLEQALAEQGKARAPIARVLGSAARAEVFWTAG